MEWAHDNPANVQERYYSPGVDYRSGSPHLTHWKLYDRLTDILRRKILALAEAGMPLRLLEVGAGHGGYTEPALAAGCSVTAVEMSKASVARLTEKYGTNPAFQAVYDPKGTLDSLAESNFSLIMCVSVLHHIPDYGSFISDAVQRLAPGGGFLSLQDPLWYPRHPTAHAIDQSSYMLWRLRKGDLRHGLATRLRRVRHILDEDNPRDTVEYHVVRQGVDEEAVVAKLRQFFESVSLFDYWSNQLSLSQHLGERLGLANMFGVEAVTYKG